MVDMNGKAALVTGAGRGLGLAYARALAAAGASVVVNDADKSAAEEAVALITADGGTAVAEPGAVGPSDVAERLVARAVDSFGRLDALVTNAGVLRDRVLWKMSDDDFDTVIDVHLRGTFTCARAAAAHMRERAAAGDPGGSLVLVGSPAGQRGNFGQTNYSAAKAGIAAMARTWSMELGRARVSVNAVVPVAATAMTATMPDFAPHVEAWQERGEPFPAWLRAGEGFGVPEDAAGLVVFLASEAGRPITGQCVGIGGDRLTLWSHPAEVSTAYREGGWGADDIAVAWATSVGREPQSVGIPAPRVPGAPGAPGAPGVPGGRGEAR